MSDSNKINIRVWSEFLTYEELRRESVISLLKKYDVGLNVSVHHDLSFDELAGLLGAYRDAGLSVGLWVLTSKEEGYFPSGRTFEAYRKRVHALLDKIEKEKLSAPHIAVDLELPLYYMELNLRKRSDRLKLRSELREGLSTKRYDRWTREFSMLRDELALRGSRTLVAATPTIADDYRSGDHFTQGIFGAPITNVNWDIVSIMWYVSMIVGYSKGLISYETARYHLWRDAIALKEALGVEHSSVSLGVTWTGVLGNEPYYKNPEDIRGDAEAAKAAGIKNLWLYNLEGVLKAKNPASWFETIYEAEPIIPKYHLNQKFSEFVRCGIITAAKTYFRTP